MFVLFVVAYLPPLMIIPNSADKKRAEVGLGHESDEDSDRPKKKKVAPKANGKSAAKGKSKR